MKKNLCLVAVAALLCGCVSTVKYPPSAGWDGPNIKPLGEVAADSGRWPLSLHTTPPEYTFYAALRDKAVAQYNVPVNSVVIGEMTVTIGAEMDGTIRDWKATALAGQKTNNIAQP